MRDFIKERIYDSIYVKKLVLEKNEEAISKTAELIIKCIKNGGKVVFCGNGGSAADAQHLAAEFVSKFRLERKGLPALALNANTSVLTAIGNDYSYDRIFARQVEALVGEGDIVIGISTSGNSQNVIQALREASALGAVTVGMTGQSGGQMAEMVEILLNIPSSDTPRIQEAHITVGHIICEFVEKQLFGD